MPVAFQVQWLPCLIKQTVQYNLPCAWLLSHYEISQRYKSTSEAHAQSTAESHSVSAGELRCEINVVVSNHPDLEWVAQAFGIEFVCISQPHAPRDQRKQRMESMLEDIFQQKGTELIVMAR